MHGCDGELEIFNWISKIPSYLQFHKIVGGLPKQYNKRGTNRGNSNIMTQYNNIVLEIRKQSAHISLAASKYTEDKHG